MTQWVTFLDGRDPTAALVLEFLETEPSQWGHAMTWLLTEHEYRITMLEEQLENQGLVRIDS